MKINRDNDNNYNNINNISPMTMVPPSGLSSSNENNEM